MRHNRIKSKPIKLLAIAITLCLFSTIIIGTSVSFDSSASNEVDKDALGNTLKDDYDSSKIITIGPGTLRWISYFGSSSDVVCIDMGDINESSWNGKAYRSLFDHVDAESLIGAYPTSGTKSLESDYVDYGVAVHDHATISSSNLENLYEWKENKPTLMIVVADIYQEFNNEMLDGIKRLGADVVTINKAYEFTDENFNLSEDFIENINILGTVLNKMDRANEFEKMVNDQFINAADLIKNKTPIYDSVYIGGTVYNGSKDLTWTCGNYLPFNIAGLTNAYTENDDHISRDAGSEVMSKTEPDIVFMDLSSTGNFDTEKSKNILEYVDLNNVSLYSLISYFWSGYNYDNGFVNAYLLMHYCYEDIFTWDHTINEIGKTYELFYPELKYGEGVETFNNLLEYYGNNGSQLSVTPDPVDVSVLLGESPPNSNAYLIWYIIGAIILGTIIAYLYKNKNILKNKRDKDLNYAGIDDYIQVNRKKKLIILATIGCLIFMLFLALYLGDTRITLDEIFRNLFHQGDEWNQYVIWDIRMKRAVVAILAGCGLGVAGAVMQCVLKNPLGSPYTLGVSNAAAFGAALGIIILGGGTILGHTGNTGYLIDNPLIVTVSAFLFSLVAIGAIVFAMRAFNSSSETMILMGMALSAIFAAGIAFLQYQADEMALSAIVFWQFGDLEKISWEYMWVLGVVAIGSILYLYTKRWDLNSMDMGDDVAQGLGINVSRLRIIVLVVSALATAVIVSFVGIIGFIGLLAPHLARKLVGNDKRFLIPASAIIGSLVLLIAMIISENAFSFTVPVGIITSLVGGPMFIWILYGKYSRKRIV